MPGTATASPYAIDAKNLLEDARYDVGDHDRPVTDADAFAEGSGVETSPLIYVEDEPIEGIDDLRRWLARNAH
jgi:hypothetical protein